MPLTLWLEAFTTAVFLTNCMTTPLLDNLSLYQKLFQTTPNYGKLRTFGSLCYTWLMPYALNKLENRSTPCVFFGYSLSQSAWLCLVPTTDRVYTSRHVRFNETQFPYQHLRRQTTNPDPEPPHQPTTYQPHTIIHPIPSLVQSPSRLQRACHRALKLCHQWRMLLRQQNLCKQQTRTLGLQNREPPCNALKLHQRQPLWQHLIIHLHDIWW